MKVGNVAKRCSKRHTHKWLSWPRILKVIKMSMLPKMIYIINHSLSKPQQWFCKNWKSHPRSSHCGSMQTNLTSIHEGSILGLAQWVKDLVGHDLWYRSQMALYPELLWLWHRPSPATLIRLLAWELSYATSAAIKKKKIWEFPWWCSGNESN